jgi:hypothetical protein
MVKAVDDANNWGFAGNDHSDEADRVDGFGKKYVWDATLNDGEGGYRMYVAPEKNTNTIATYGKLDSNDPSDHATRVDGNGNVYVWDDKKKGYVAIDRQHTDTNLVSTYGNLNKNDTSDHPDKISGDGLFKYAWDEEANEGRGGYAVYAINGRDLSDNEYNYINGYNYDSGGYHIT